LVVGCHAPGHPDVAQSGYRSARESEPYEPAGDHASSVAADNPSQPGVLERAFKDKHLSFEGTRAPVDPWTQPGLPAPRRQPAQSLRPQKRPGASDPTPGAADADPDVEQVSLPGERAIFVSTTEELTSAVRGLQSGETVVVAAGTYQLSAPLSFTGGLTDVGIRGATGDPSDVVLTSRDRQRADRAAVPFGIQLGSVQRIRVADLTIRDFSRHAVVVTEASGCQQPHIVNCHLLNTGEQLVKVNVGLTSRSGCSNGIVERSLFEFRDAVVGDRSGGVDIAAGRGWSVRDCVFRNIRAPVKTGSSAGPAVRAWGGSFDTLVERNRFFDCDQEIVFGGAQSSDGHTGGIVRNNVIFRRPGTGGKAGVTLWNARATLVVHNTIVMNGGPPGVQRRRTLRARPDPEAPGEEGRRLLPERGGDPVEPQEPLAERQTAVEDRGDPLHPREVQVVVRKRLRSAITYRHNTRGSEICNNLTDSAIESLEGGDAHVWSNATNVTGLDFVDFEGGDLHLVSTSTMHHAAPVHRFVQDDCDGRARSMDTKRTFGAYEQH
jgi:hypothetical protein